MPKIEDSYLTIKKAMEGDYREKGSKFLAYAYEVTTEDEVKSNLDDLRKLHPKARHFCYAYQLGLGNVAYRANDDGEPSGSAGLPILNTIKSHYLTDVLVVVVRYFGGTLLGVSGLINAYKSAASEALINAETVEKTIKKELLIRFDYPQMNGIIQLIKTYEITIKKQTYDTKSGLVLEVRLSVVPVLETAFSEMEGVELEILDN